MIFSPQWFTRHQKILLWFANSWIGRRILCINGQKSSVGKNKIIKILPNSITWKTGKKYHTEFRTHDKFGKRLFYAFKPFWYLCHLWDMAWYPNFNLGFDAYPNIYSTAGGDGFVRGWDNNANIVTAFQNIRAYTGAANCGHDDTSAEEYLARCIRTSEPSSYIYRGFLPFDISSITDAASVIATGTKLSLYVTAKGDSNSKSLALIKTTQASATALENTDMDNITLNTPDEGCTRVTIASISTGAYNDFSANANLVTWIKAGSPLKLGMRVSSDVDNDFSAYAQSDDDGIKIYFADQTGTSNDPKLVVTYTGSSGYIFISS